jgi:predicted ribonuclease YlaK
MARKLNYNIAKANLNEEQHQAKELIEKKPVSIITGKAGSGKTFLSVAIGIEKIIQKEVRKLYFIRPTVGTEDIGFLKGSMHDKMEP